MFLTCRYGGDVCGDKRERVILILKNMAKRETGKREETADVTAQVLEELI